MKRIYFDYAASTPIDRNVLKEMLPFFTKKFGNPGSLHAWGQEGIAAIDTARARIARLLGISFRGILFTGSATEANNLALRGSVKRFKETHPKMRPRIIVSAIEHESVLETARDLGRDGVEVIFVPVGVEGIADVKSIESALNERTVLVSVMYVNNEIGSIQPIARIAKLIENHRLRRDPARSGGWKLSRRSRGLYPLFHTDAVQAFQYLDCALPELRADMMTLSAHKLYGPKGIGILAFKDGDPKSCVAPLVTGGGQEFGLRSGTENVPEVVGFAKAMELVHKMRSRERTRLAKLKKYFIREISSRIPGTFVNGTDDSDHSAPHIVNFSFPGASIDEMFVRFDMAGVAVSTGSACAARAATRSHVLSALALRAPRGIRVSFGRGTTEREVRDALLRVTGPRGK